MSPLHGARSVGVLLLAAMCVVFFSRVQLLLGVLMKEVLHPESQSPNGVRFHLIDVYLDELAKVGGKEVSGRLRCPPRGGGATAGVHGRPLFFGCPGSWRGRWSVAGNSRACIGAPCL